MEASDIDLPEDVKLPKMVLKLSRKIHNQRARLHQLEEMKGWCGVTYLDKVLKGYRQSLTDVHKKNKKLHEEMSSNMQRAWLWGLFIGLFIGAMTVMTIDKWWTL